MMKKLSLRILASLMALLLIMGLAACGGNGGTESSSAPEESSQPVSEPDVPVSEDSEPVDSEPEDSSATTDSSDTSKVTTTRKVSTGKKAATWAEIKAQIPSGASSKTLRVYDWNPQSEVKGMEAMHANFTKETGIKVNYEIVNYDSYFTKITSEVAAKNAPDAVRLQNVTRTNLINLQPMQDLGYDFTDAAWDKNIMNAYTFNGNLYGVNMVGSPFYCPVMIFYNKNLINTYDLDDPYELWKDGKWTWDKLWEMCEEFVENAPDDSFLGYGAMAQMEYQFAYNKPTITYNKKTNTFSHNLKDENYIKSWQIYANNFDKGLISRALSNVDDFNAGKLLFTAWDAIASRNGSAAFRAIRSQGAVACVPLPALKKGTKDYQLIAEPQAFGIPKTAKNAALVPYYLRYYFDADNYDMKNFYNVDHAAEVHKYIQTKNPAINYNGAVINKELSGMHASQFLDALKTGGSANVMGTLDSYVPTLEAAMKEAEAFYAEL